MFGMNNFFPEIPRPFNTQYRCYPVAMLPGSERSDVEGGGKIIMPPSALDQLTRLNIVYPMLFKLTNRRIDKTTHCGVLEFVADEGKIYIPYWMMQNLMVEEGGLVQVRTSSQPRELLHQSSVLGGVRYPAGGNIQQVPATLQGLSGLVQP